MLAVPVLLALASTAAARTLTPLQHQIIRRDPEFSHSVSACPGYSLGDISETTNGLTAHLSLAGAACNAFGTDIANLTLQVSYESEKRLHVKISDTDTKQYDIPEAVIARPLATSNSSNSTSDLVFNHNPSPFEFWITRRSNPDAPPLFDTRASSLPPTPIPPVKPADNSTALDGFALVFEDQYLQLTSALPLDANIYGLGEVVASSGFRRDVGGTNSTGGGTVQTMWARDIADPIDENVYGSHPMYLEHRLNKTAGTSQSHGVFLLSAAGSDILLLTPPSSNSSLIEYRLLGGVFDFYFLSGPSPQDVIEQYSAVVGLPAMQPLWAFGFQLCRWGYQNVSETRDVVKRMKDAGVPLEVMWNDIDLYHAVRDFTTDPVSFPADDMRAFIGELSDNDQRYIPIVDAAIAKQVNASDNYDVYTSGVEQKVFITNPDGSEYVGQVWPGYTVFPDWFANNTQAWWTDAFRNWSDAGGVNFSGIWLDMNEASSFCDGSCGSGNSVNLSNTSTPFVLPGLPGNLILDYPECYNLNVSGPSGNITVNGTLTCGLSASTLEKRADEQDINAPPYAIHNGNGPLSIHALATNATHADGSIELDVHNMWGLMEEKATYASLKEVLPGKRPFLISRSTSPSSGKWTGHWLGDNFSKWQYMYFSIQGVLQFQLFSIPFVGADTCGFNGNTDEELCSRWMQLAAFTPFYRNHNVKGAISQEPYVWDSVASASKTAIAIRYSLLPYWYTLFANASARGTPPVRALWFEFPDEPELFGVDRQFLIGRDILVTPVLAPNVSTVDDIWQVASGVICVYLQTTQLPCSSPAIFPGRGSTIWRDWYTHAVIEANTTTLEAPLGHINVHIRDGSAVLLHSAPGYTTTETRAGPFSLLVSLSADGGAFGTGYLDDGESDPPAANRTVTFLARHGGNTTHQILISGQGSFAVEQTIETVTVLGVGTAPTGVTVRGKTAVWKFEETIGELVISGLDVSLNDEEDTVIEWDYVLTVM